MPRAAKPAINRNMVPGSGAGGVERRTTGFPGNNWAFSEKDDDELAASNRERPIVPRADPVSPEYVTLIASSIQGGKWRNVLPQNPSPDLSPIYEWFAIR